MFLEYLELRKKIRAVNTERAVSTLIKILEPYTTNIKLEMIEKAIVNSWKSIYPLKDDIPKTKILKHKQYEQRPKEDLESYYDNV